MSDDNQDVWKTLMAYERRLIRLETMESGSRGLSHVTWIGGADATANNTATGTPQRFYEEKGSWANTRTTATGSLVFPFPIPYQWLGQAVVVSSITIYYRTVDTAYIDTVSLKTADLDASITAQISHTDNLGEAAGDGNHDIVDTAYTMTDFPHWLQVDFVGVDTAEDIRVYGFRVEWGVV
jgi:hypothetical protein